jgi:hypothetical protein
MAVCDCTVCGPVRLFDRPGQDAGSVLTWLCGMRAIVQGDADLSAVGGFLQERASSQPLGVVGRAHKACFDVLPPPARRLVLWADASIPECVSTLLRRAWPCASMTVGLQLQQCCSPKTVSTWTCVC